MNALTYFFFLSFGRTYSKVCSDVQIFMAFTVRVCDTACTRRVILTRATRARKQAVTSSGRWSGYGRAVFGSVM